MNKIFFVFIFSLYFIYGELIYRDEKITTIVASSIKQVSVPIIYNNGILFTFNGNHKDDVFISGDFWSWNKEKRLQTNLHGIFFAFISLSLDKGFYNYRYRVNNIWINDPQQSFYRDDGYGTKISGFKLEKKIIQYITSPKKMEGNYYQFFLKDKAYKTVYWIGTANNWDSFVSPMKKKDGYWTLTLKMEKNRTFYQFVVDGVEMLDPENPHQALKQGGEMVSYLPELTTY